MSNTNKKSKPGRQPAPAPRQLGPTSRGPVSPQLARRDGIVLPAHKRCVFRTQKGTPCRAARRSNSEFCIFHDPTFQEREIKLRVGVHFFSLRRTPDSAEGIHELLRRNVEAVASGKISPKVANSISYAAQLMIANLPALEGARSTYNITRDTAHEFEQQFVTSKLDELEQEIKQAGEDACPVKAAKAFRDSQASPHKPAVPIAPGEPAQASGRAPAAQGPHSAQDDPWGPPPPWAAELEEIAAGRRKPDPGPDEGSTP